MARAEAVPRRVTCGGIHLILFMGNLLLRDNDQIVGAFARIKPSKGPCCGGDFDRMTGSTVSRFLQKNVRLVFWNVWIRWWALLVACS